MTCNSKDGIQVAESSSVFTKQPRESLAGGALDTQPRCEKNPLHWFGILVPPVLRDSQHHFALAALGLIKLADIKGKLDLLDMELRNVTFP